MYFIDPIDSKPKKAKIPIFPKKQILVQSQQ